MKRPFQTRQDPLAMLRSAVQAMGAYVDQLRPDEKSKFEAAARELRQGRMPARELVLELQHAYLRLKVMQEGFLKMAEEQMAYLVGSEADAVQTARMQLDGGNLLAFEEQLKPLYVAHMRAMGPALLEVLEGQAPLLTDTENMTLTQARLEYDQNGVISPPTVHEIMRLKKALHERQFMF